MSLLQVEGAKDVVLELNSLSGLRVGSMVLGNANAIDALCKQYG
jgi:aspartate/methionine/tyrosine aminotransferase